MIFTVHTDTCSIYCEEINDKWIVRQSVNRVQHRPLNPGEHEPLVVIKPDELIVRTDWEAMLKLNTEEEIRGVK